MDTCELFEMQASSFLDGEPGLDGELGFHEQIMLVDHLLACPACRRFYEQARELQDFVDELSAAPEDLGLASLAPGGPEEASQVSAQDKVRHPLLDAASETDEKPSPSQNKFQSIAGVGRSGGGIAAARRAPRWIWAAAAMIIFLIYLFTGVLFEESPIEEAPFAQAPSAGGTIDLRLASDGGRMDESRFVALTLELLRGDARYHRKMYQILAELQAGSIPIEGEATTALNRDEGGFSPAGNSEIRRRENPTGESTASAVF